MADKRALKLSTMDDGPVFLLFNRLPWELRHMIWKQALPRPIPQVLAYKSETFPKWDPKTNTWDATDGPPRVPIPPPALLHATQESRKFALEHVLVHEDKPFGLDSHRIHRVVSRPFDREKDALYIHPILLIDFIEVYMATTPWAARHLLFDGIIYTSCRRGFSRFLNRSSDVFESADDRVGRGLRSVALVAPSSCDHLLTLEIMHVGAVKGYYRAVPDEEAMAQGNSKCERLAAAFRGRQGPNGVPWKAVVGSGRLCGADGGDDDEDILECSQVVLERFTASTMDQD